MEALDLKKFVWIEKSTELSYVITGIITYRNEDLVVYRRATGQDRRILCLSVDEFADGFDPTYKLETSKTVLDRAA